MVDRYGVGCGGTCRIRAGGDAGIRVAALIPAGFAIGAALCALLLRHAPAAIGVDLAQPLAVVTYWQQFGALMWLALFVAVSISSIGYCWVLKSPFDRLRVTMAYGAVACLLALLMPVVFSSDVYAYAGYGDMALHGINPYAHARIALRDPLLDAMVWQWGNPPPMCVYGPAFVWLAQGIVALLLPLGAAAPLWAFRILACLALVACAPLAYAAFKPLGEKRARLAAAGIALNPMAIWACAEGHNDAIVLAIVLAGFALAARSRAFAGALLIALGALVKAPALAAAGGYALAVWNNRALRRPVIAGAIAGAAIVFAIAAPLEYGVRAHLAPAGHYFPQFSLQYLSLPLALLLCMVFAILGVRDVLRGSLQGAAYLGFAAFMAIPNPYPWYGLWLLPLAFLGEDARVMWALVAASLLIVLRYYGDATTDLSYALSVTIVVLEYALPLALLSAARMRTARPDRPENRRAALGFATHRRS
jgi:hypothetical protein